EALASGLAIVAYDYAAARSHLTDGETGALVPFGSRTAFVDTAVQLALAPHQVGTIRRNAREHATTLTWGHIVQRFESLLTGHDDRQNIINNSVAGRKNLATMAGGSI